MDDDTTVGGHSITGAPAPKAARRHLALVVAFCRKQPERVSVDIPSPQPLPPTPPVRFSRRNEGGEEHTAAALLGLVRDRLRDPR